MRFTQERTTLPLLGHGLQVCGNIAPEWDASGYLAPEPIKGADGELYALFTIPDDGTQPAIWAGTYRLPLSRLIQSTTGVNDNKCRILESEV